MTTRLRMMALLVAALWSPLRVQGQPPIICDLSVPAAPFMRLEASAELTGDVLMTCTGGVAGQSGLVNIYIFANVNLTSRILDGTQATEALVLIDDPAPAQQVLNATVFQGTVASANQIAF